MGNFKRLTMPLAKIKANQQNPRIISESKLKKLINSLLVFPKMMTLRPITLDENDFVLGGNMRQTALNRIAQMSKEQLQETIEQAGEYQAMTDDERQATLKYWLRFLKKPQVEVQVASDLTEDERQQFIIKDNVSFGDWDYDELENWDNAKLESWGLDTLMPDFKEAGGGNLPPELNGVDMNPDELQKLSGEDKTPMERVIITYYKKDEHEVAALLGLESIEKVVYNLDELKK